MWNEQKRHVPCLQDPPGISLYTQTGNLMKGGIKLPVYRCARGSTSLESFHRHIVNFILGTAANCVNFQAYLLEGLARWNQLRMTAATDLSRSEQKLRSFDTHLVEMVNRKYTSVFGSALVTSVPKSSRYTGELLGVEYLLQQSGLTLPQNDEEMDKQIDEGVAVSEHIEDTNNEDLLLDAENDVSNTDAQLLNYEHDDAVVVEAAKDNQPGSSKVIRLNNFCVRQNI